MHFKRSLGSLSKLEFVLGGYPIRCRKLIGYSVHHRKFYKDILFLTPKQPKPPTQVSFIGHSLTLI